MVYGMVLKGVYLELTDTPNSETKVALRKYSHKKKLRKMEGLMHKFRSEKITFEELIHRFKNIEEFYNDD